MSTRSLLGFIMTMDALRKGGFEVDKPLKQLGINLAQLTPEGEIERAHELRLLSAVAESLTDPLAGLKAGAIRSLAGYGPLTMLLVTSSTPWEAMQMGVRYQALTYLYGTLALIPGERLSALIIKPVPLPGSCRRFIIDRDMVGTYQLVQDIQINLGLDIHPVKVTFPYPKPKEYKVYEQHFGCPVEFDGEEGEFLFRNEDALIPFPAGNRNVHLMYRDQCEQLLKKRESEMTTLADQVASHLALFVGDFPTADDVARTFGLAERTFRRRLSTESTSFRKVLDGVRYRKACELLRETDLSIEGIATRLGYAESAAFNHAFQRWAGMSPGEYRVGSQQQQSP
jgi:AraC-like DNA-binding protein